jgi:hypothetical protein
MSYKTETIDFNRKDPRECLTKSSEGEFHNQVLQTGSCGPLVGVQPSG